MSKQNYDALLTEIEAITEAETKQANMPIDKFLQEAANLTTPMTTTSSAPKSPTTTCYPPGRCG